MKSKILIIIFLFLGLKSFTQTDKYIGLNLLQLPALTINTNLSIDYKPYLTPVIDIGYTINYVKANNIDWVGFFLTPHIKLYDGYTIDKQSGGYLKIGGFINLRKDFVRKNYIHLGLFITNSLVYEKGLYLSPIDSRPYSYADKIEHTVYLFGLSTSLGYEFSLTKRIKINLDFQLSIPNNKYLDLYGYSNFIPGMGFKDTEERWFPMLILNIKYRI